MKAICLLPLLAAGLSLAHAESVFKEDFAGKKLDAPWRWVREVASDWRLRDGALELRAQKGRVWGGNDAKNILLLDRPTAGHSASVQVDLGSPETVYEQGGLLLYQDHDNFVKLIVEHIDGEIFIVLAREVEGRGQVVSKIGIPSKQARLRLAMNGLKIEAAYRVDATGGDEAAWKQAGSCDFPTAEKARFGLFTQDGSDEEIRWIRFDDFELHEAP